MKDSSDSKYATRASTATGASLGAIPGALLAAWIFQSSLSVIIGAAVGAAIGAVVGVRVKSQMPQFLWIEYPRNIARKIILSALPFLVLFLVSIYLIKAGAEKTILTILLSATSVTGFIFIYSIGTVISQLDDVLRGIQLEAIGIGFGLAAFILLTLGLFSLIIPVWSDWLVGFIIMLGCMLVGRIVVAWKYR